MKNLFKKFIRWLLDFPMDCPEKCGGKIHLEDYDGEFDRNIWKCDKCGHEFI